MDEDSPEILAQNIRNTLAKLRKFKSHNSDSSDDMGDIDDMSTINGKPVDATANLVIQFDLKECTTPIEKVFGVMLKESNVVLKFNSILLDFPSNHEGDKKFQLIYLSEDPIDCKVKWNDKKPEILQNMTCGNQVSQKIFRYNTYLDCIMCSDITISLSLKMPSQGLPLTTQIASSFNDESSSDFIVECQEKLFYVHQYILMQRSEYFAGLLRNNCIESKSKRIAINDFEPQIVEILLRYLYNGAVCWSAIKSKRAMKEVIKIADKYNFTGLADAIDSYYAQHHQCFLDSLDSHQQLAGLESAILLVDETLLPKMAILIFLWKNSEQSQIGDEQWSKLIRCHPGFAQRMANIACRKDYQEWGRQHRSWGLRLEQSLPSADAPAILSDSAIIVGPLGEMKGAVKCSSIL